MADLLRPTVTEVVQEHAKKMGILKPKLAVTEASKNGDSYSGHVYRIVITSEEEENVSQDQQNNNK